MILREPEDTLKQRIARLVVTGVERGLVIHDKESGLATARAISTPPKPEAFQSTLEYLEASRPASEEYSAVEDLRFALDGGYAQEVALAALGFPRSTSGVQNSFLALSMLRQLALVAQGVAPPEVLGSVRGVLESRHAEITELKTAQWLSALETIFRTGLHLQSDREPTPAESVLAYLAAMIEPPVAMAHPKPDQIKKANRLLSSLRVKGLRLEVQPGQRRKGPADSAWGAAVKFAACFGLKAPANRRDARRSR